MNTENSQDSAQSIMPNPHEPVMIRFVSEATGHTYDPQMVDHLADMLLIFYAGGGTALGTIAGTCAAASFFLHTTDTQEMLTTLPLGGLIGGVAGALLVMLLLNIRGLVKWDRLQITRTYKVKAK
jgi:hypothetical protein